MKYPVIKGLPLYQLKNAKPHIESAILAWKRNDYEKDKEEQEYNILFFEGYLLLVNKELKRYEPR